MAQALLQEILNQLQALEIEELKEVDQAVQQYLVAKALTSKNTVFDQALLGSGLIEHIKHPTYRQETDQELFQVQGQALSETIIEERR